MIEKLKEEIKALDLLNVRYEQLAEGCHFRGLQLPKRGSK
jgi:hypothetical protein